MKQVLLFLASVLLLTSYSCNTNEPTQRNPHSGSLFEYTDNLETRWSSFENLNGEKGRGGQENNGGKGHPYDKIEAGGRTVLLDTKGPGIINRMWFTIQNRSPEALRGLVLNMYWDNAEKPAVSVPFGDFFGIGLGKTAVYENALFANPEGRSFNSFVQMPFKEAARIELVNELDYDMYLLFFDVNYQLMKRWDDDFLYFHAYWHRDTATTVGDDFHILPKVEGKGRFLGTNVGVVANPKYGDSWWGEGEVKIYLNGDKDYATLVGTGTEDYIGTGWGQGVYAHQYTGCPIADDKNKQWAFYRYHIPDPVFFATDCNVRLQQMGGTIKKDVIELQKKGIDLAPVTINGDSGTWVHLYNKDSLVNLESPDLPGDDYWTNFFRSDDVSAVAYFYLHTPTSNLPPIQNLAIRTWNLKE